MYRGLVLFLLICLSGCVPAGVKQQRQKAMDEAVPVCMTDKQCSAEWDAAVAWVSAHCGMKIQNQTGSLIQTYNSPAYSAETACLVNKQPVDGGRYALVIKVGCSNIIGCQPAVFDQVMDFDAYVKQAGSSYSPILIGAAFREIQSDGSIAQISAESSALKVMAILAGSRSERSGLKVGDVVQSANGHRLRTQREWTEYMITMRGGDLLTLGIIRGGVREVVDIHL